MFLMIMEGNQSTRRKSTLTLQTPHRKALPTWELTPGPPCCSVNRYTTLLDLLRTKTDQIHDKQCNARLLFNVGKRGLTFRPEILNLVSRSDDVEVG